jgi:hypothetical protein
MGKSQTGKGEAPMTKRTAMTDASYDPWWTAQLLKLGENAAAFERIEQIPVRGNALVQRAHDLVASVRNGDPSAREELEIILEILSNRQDQPKQPRDPRKPSLARLVAKAKQLGVDLTVEPNGAATLRTGSTTTAADENPQTELDEWISKHAH